MGRPLAALCLLGLLGACAATAREQGGGAVEFTLRDVHGRNVRLSDYRGQVVLIDFWATWCVPCEAAMPHLERLFEERRAEGFVVLAVAMDGPETVARVAPFARRYRLSFPVLLDEETTVVGLYNPKRTAPLSLLLDRHGQVARVHEGYAPGDERILAGEVAKLLGGR